MSSIDFTIGNYSDEELYQLVNLSPDATKTEIYTQTNTLIQKYIEGNKPLYTNFFIGIQNRLLEILELGEESENDGDEFIKTEYEPNMEIDQDLVNRSSYAKIVEDGNNNVILRRERLPLGQGTSIPFVQGQMNPTLRNMKKLLINVDSSYRKLLTCVPTESEDCSGVVCPSGNLIRFADTATDFTFNLSQPVKHVLKMCLHSYEIPHSWYVFAEDYGTTRFMVGNTCVDISAGNYDPSGLVQELNAALVAAGTTVTATLNSINQKITFSSGGSFELIFYDASGQFVDCSNVPCGTKRGKLDYNLGWLLGFRQPSYSGETSYTGEALVDTYGFRYLFVEVDDFNHNRLNQGIVSLSSNRDAFSYSASKRCSIPVSTIPTPLARSCGKGPNPPTGAPLTAVETYTRAQLLNAQREGFPDRFMSAVNSDILARIPVRKFNHYDILFDNGHGVFMETAREYFGPVTLKRLRVRLLNDKGFVVNLNNMNFSFSIIIDHLYQY